MMDRGTVRAVKPPPGAKILGTTTRTEYKTSNGIFDKRKVRMCVRGDQQVEGQDYFQQDIYAPTLKAQEARLIASIAAQHGTKSSSRRTASRQDMSCYCARVCMVHVRQQESGTSASHDG